MVYDFVRDFTEKHGHPPSVRETGVAVGIPNVGSIYYHLVALTKQGALRPCSCGCGRHWLA